MKFRQSLVSLVAIFAISVVTIAIFGTVGAGNVQAQQVNGSAIRSQPINVRIGEESMPTINIQHGQLPIKPRGLIELGSIARFRSRHHIVPNDVPSSGTPCQQGQPPVLIMPDDVELGSGSQVKIRMEVLCDIGSLQVVINKYLIDWSGNTTQFPVYYGTNNDVVGWSTAEAYSQLSIVDEKIPTWQIGTYEYAITVNQSSNGSVAVLSQTVVRVMANTGINPQNDTFPLRIDTITQQCVGNTPVLFLTGKFPEGQPMLYAVGSLGLATASFTSYPSVSSSDGYTLTLYGIGGCSSLPVVHQGKVWLETGDGAYAIVSPVTFPYTDQY